ncbi:MAG: hypothetical protein AAGE65_03455 [Planctomycetota bacterium]
MTAVDTLSHDVYFRSPGSSAWRLAEDLRCLTIESTLGPSVGSATLRLASDTGDLHTLTTLYDRIGPDDEVQVRVDPLDLPRVGPVLDGRAVAFEGVVHRRSPVVQSADGRESADATLAAWPAPVEANLAEGSMVTGRWIADPNAGAGATVHILETRDLPAVFNFDGAANRHGSATVTAGGLNAPVFTHDDDAAGAAWTVREALAALLVQWMPPAQAYGLAIEAETLAALDGSDTSGARWEGLDDLLPETNVHGLGVLDALQVICDAVGFEFACVPTFASPSGANSPYELKLWRRDAGPEVTIKLNRPGRDRTPTQALRNNTHSRVALVADAGRCRPVTRVVGASVIECTVELRPLWDPADAETPDLTGALALAGTTIYHAQHVAGGASFAEFGHVGRLWGVDCTGSAVGYIDGPYRHPGGAGLGQIGEGFDWVTELALNTPGSGLTADRAAHGVTDPIVWSRRPRPLLPLRRPADVRRGLPYFVEISEDAGATWAPAPIQVRSAAPLCGLRLVGVPNLAAVNLATLGTGDAPPIEESWWALIFGGNVSGSGGGGVAAGELRVRVTACVPADHAAVARAARRPNAGVQRDRLLLRESSVEEVWSAPGSELNQSGGWELLAGNVPDGETLDQRFPVLAHGERLRDAHDGLRLAGSAYSWVMDLGRHAVGDRVTRVEGQDLSLNTSRHDADRAPTVASVSIRLWPESEQGIALDLRDRDVATQARLPKGGA